MRTLEAQIAEIVLPEFLCMVLSFRKRRPVLRPSYFLIQVRLFLAFSYRRNIIDVAMDMGYNRESGKKKTALRFGEQRIAGRVAIHLVC